MTRRTETIALSVLYLACGTMFFLVIPRFISMFEDMPFYQGGSVPLPSLTRAIIAVPSVLWLVGGIVAAVAIPVLNRKRNSPWISLGFLVGLIVIVAIVVAALFLPVIVDVVTVSAREGVQE